MGKSGMPKKRIQDSVALTKQARKHLQEMRAEWSKKAILSAALIAFAKLDHEAQRELIRAVNLADRKERTKEP